MVGGAPRPGSCEANEVLARHDDLDENRSLLSELINRRIAELNEEAIAIINSTKRFCFSFAFGGICATSYLQSSHDPCILPSVQKELDRIAYLVSMLKKGQPSEQMVKEHVPGSDALFQERDEIEARLESAFCKHDRQLNSQYIKNKETSAVAQNEFKVPLMTEVVGIDNSHKSTMLIEMRGRRKVKRQRRRRYKFKFLDEENDVPENDAPEPTLLHHMSGLFQIVIMPPLLLVWFGISWSLVKAGVFILWCWEPDWLKKLVEGMFCSHLRQLSTFVSCSLRSAKKKLDRHLKRIDSDGCRVDIPAIASDRHTIQLPSSRRHSFIVWNSRRWREWLKSNKKRNVIVRSRYHNERRKDMLRANQLKNYNRSRGRRRKLKSETADTGCNHSMTLLLMVLVSSIAIGRLLLSSLILLNDLANSPECLARIFCLCGALLQLGCFEEHPKNRRASAARRIAGTRVKPRHPRMGGKKTYKDISREAVLRAKQEYLIGKALQRIRSKLGSTESGGKSGPSGRGCDWCGTSDCGGCGTLVADLAREALDEEDSLRPSEVGDAQAFDSLLGTCDAVANEMNSMLRQMESMAHEMYNSDEESEAGRDNSKNDMQVVVEDVVSCCDSMYNEENNQRPGEGESFMVPNDTFLESLQPLVDRLRHDDTSLGSSGNESDKSGAIPFLLSRGDDSQSSGCDSMYSDEVIRRLEGGDTFMESLQPLVDRLPRDDMSLGSSGTKRDESEATPSLVSRGDNSYSTAEEPDSIPRALSRCETPVTSAGSEVVDMMFGGGESSSQINFSVCRQDGKQCLVCNRDVVNDDIMVHDQQQNVGRCHLECWDASTFCQPAINDSPNGDALVYKFATEVKKDWSELTCFNRSLVINHIIDTNQRCFFLPVSIYDFPNLAPCGMCVLCGTNYTSVASKKECGTTTRGLVNLGRTCYMNSTLQCLAHTHLLSNHFTTRTYYEGGLKSNSGTSDIVEAFSTVLKDMWERSDDGLESLPTAVNIDTFKRVIEAHDSRYKGCHDQDSQEFQLYLIDALNDATNRNRTNEKVQLSPRVEKRRGESDKEASNRALVQSKQISDSYVNELFMGQLRNNLNCKECGHVSTAFEASNTLSVPIRFEEGKKQATSGDSEKTLFACIGEYCKREELGADWECPMCKKKVGAWKQLQLYRPPRVLLVHLKRFEDPTRKIDDQVDFPLNGLDLSDLMTSDGVQHWDEGEKPVYDCYAVSNHYGQLGRGHYTAFTKDFDQDVWNCYDDTAVKRNIDERSVVSNAAYHIFYKRRDVEWSSERSEEKMEGIEEQGGRMSVSDELGTIEEQMVARVVEESIQGSSKAITDKLNDAPVATPKKRGRPRKANALTSAEISRRYKQKKRDEINRAGRDLYRSNSGKRRKKQKRVRDTRLKRTSSQIESDKAKMRKRNKDTRSERTPSQIESDKAKLRKRVRRMRMARTEMELTRGGKFNKAKCWQEPGKDYNFRDFTNDPEASALLWYGNNGSWRFREMKWLRAFIRLSQRMRDGIDDFYERKRSLDRLLGLYRECVKLKVTLCQVVFNHTTEKDRLAIQAWHDENMMNDEAMAALEWFARHSSTPLGSIAYDPPVDGGNCLFDALLKGLQRVCPEDVRHIQGVDDFRTELMECLDDSVFRDKVANDRTLVEWARLSWKSKFGTLGRGWTTEKYSNLMRHGGSCNKCHGQSTCKCKWGGILEQALCAHSWKVNVTVQCTSDARRNGDDCTASDIIINESFPTIPLSYDGSHYRLLRNENETQWCPLDDDWARSLIGRKLRVPGWWWGDRADKKYYDCLLKDVDYADKAERYFSVECEDDGILYPMAYVDLRKFADFAAGYLPPQPYQNKRDEAYIALCEETSVKLEDENFDSDSQNARLFIFVKHAIKRGYQIIDSQRITPEKQKQAAEEFLHQQWRGVPWSKYRYEVENEDEEYKAVDGPLFACASCGLRSMGRGDESYYGDKNVRDLNWATLDSNDASDFVKNMEEQTLLLPTSNKGDFKQFDCWKARSVWPAVRPDELTEDENLPDWMFEVDGEGKPDRFKPKYFHLHPEFVEECKGVDDKKGFKVKLCRLCYHFDCQLDELSSQGWEESELPKGPTRSIANGVDFGSPKRVGLTPLTPRERQIISKMRHYYCAVKIESNEGPQREHTHYAIKGHSICYDHDSPRVVEDLLSEEGINDSIDIQFVGPEGQYDQLARKTLGSSQVSARPFVVYQWLQVLRQVNEHYVRDNELPPFDDVVKLVDKCNETLVKDAVMTSNEKVIIETMVGKDDVAQVRAAPGYSDVAANVSEDGQEFDSSFRDDRDEDFPMKYSYCTQQKKSAHDMNTDDAHDYLLSAAKTLGVNVSEAKNEYNDSKVASKFAESRRSDVPSNEFAGGDTGEKDEALRKSFPDVFFLGKAYDRTKPSLNAEQVKHLLLQYTSNGASCRPLLFYLFNQKQRHGTIKGMHAKYSSNKEAFSNFAQDYVSSSFQNKLKEAVRDPDGKVAKEVIQKIEPILVGGGKATIFGAVQSQETAGKILAMTRRFACAPAFLTFAMDDVNHPTSIRLSIGSSNNIDYPATVSGEAHEAMKHGFKYSGDGSVSIPASYTARFKALVRNPIGAAFVYKSLVNDVLSILAGRKPALGQNEQSRKKTEFTSWDHENIGVIVGTTLAYIGVTETTGRGSLHFHVVLWGGLSPELLEMVSDVPELCERIGDVLNSCYSAEMPRDVHVRDLVSRELKQSSKSSAAFRRMDSAARSMQIPPDPTDKDGFQGFVYCTVCGRNIHGHSYTCHKPPNGARGCRMCKPSGLRNGTKAVELVWDRDSDMIELEVKEVVSPATTVPRNPSNDFSPLVSPDERTIVWEIKRPELAGFLALNAEMEDDAFKQEIISKLAEAMNASELESNKSFSPAQVDEITFIDDNDTLFHCMLKWLVIAGVTPAYEKSVRDLRVELTSFLGECGQETFEGKTADELSDTDWLLLLSKVYGVRVRLYSKDKATAKFHPEKVLHPENDDGSAIQSIYLVIPSSDDECYSIFVPKAYSIMREIQSLDKKDLYKLYSKVDNKIKERNGVVVEFNPLLTALLGCNTNLQLLGSKEQSKLALFYIGPYINKNGVKLTDALPLLRHAQDHAMQYPSSAEDADTSKRLVQFIVSRVLNKMNSSMEISDTQAALALLGMGASICSETFTNYDLNSTRNFVLDDYFGVMEPFDQICSGYSAGPGSDNNEDDIYSMTMDQLKDALRERGLKVGGRKDVLIDRLKNSIEEGVEVDPTAQMLVAELRSELKRRGLESKGKRDELRGRLRDAMEVSESERTCSSTDETPSREMEVDDQSQGEESVSDCDSSLELDSESGELELVTENIVTIDKVDDGDGDAGDCAFIDDESSVDDSVAEPVKLEGSSIAVNLNYVSGKYGQGKIINTTSIPGGTFSSVPYPMFYRCRGEELRMLNRLEYHSFVEVKRREKIKNELDDDNGRPSSREFSFGKGLEECIGGEGVGVFFQYLRSKQCTPKFFSSPPRHPGRRPADDDMDSSKQKQWRNQADKFACNYLIMFRPEEDLYEDGQKCQYEYNWEAFVEFIRDLKSSDRAIDHSRLEMIERMVHSRGVNYDKKEALKLYRERKRDIWSEEERTMAKSELAKYKRMFQGDDDEEDEMLAFDSNVAELTTRERNDAIKMIQHANDCERVWNTSREGCSESEPLQVKTTNFNEDFARSLAMLQPNRAADEGSSARYPEQVMEKRVDEYLVKQDLSMDKAPVINAMREHFRALYDGRALEKDYNPPLLLVCGGPGNGKSELVKTFDGMTNLMGVGEQVKTAYLGVAAVNIGGTALCTLLNIPTDRDPRKRDNQNTIVPWSTDRKQKFKRLYDVDRIGCFVIDEISTVQPQMLAYLSHRLMELYPESGKDFGGKAVVLLGDFHQLPPVGGDGNIAKSAMAHEEKRQGPIQRWDTTQHALNVKREGIRLFQKASYFNLTTQHRSKDRDHTAFIEQMRESGRVSLEGLRKYKLLKGSDTTSSKDFRFATVLVTGNQERHKLNHSTSLDWASYHQTNVVRWLRQIDREKWKGMPKSKEGLANVIRQNGCFYESFIPGARGFLNANINTSIGLANGTEIKYDSISFINPRDQEEYKRFMSSKEAGEPITLDKPPDAINVELFADHPGDTAKQIAKNKASRESWIHQSLATDGRVVIPIAYTRYKSFMDYEKNYVMDQYRGRNGSLISVDYSNVRLKDYFPIEPGFSMTVHKAQGRTIRKIVLSISDHAHHKLRHTWEGIYTALTRVEYGDDMRLLVRGGDWGTVKLLCQLEKCRLTQCFFEGYRERRDDEPGHGMIWDRKLAKEAHDMARKEENVKLKEKRKRRGKEGTRLKKRLKPGGGFVCLPAETLDQIYRKHRVRGKE